MARTTAWRGWTRASAGSDGSACAWSAEERPVRLILMTLAALAFAAGAAFLQQQGALPAVAWVWLLPVCALFLRVQRLALVACFAIGFLWAVGWAHWRMADRLAPELEGRDIAVV